MLNVSRRVNHKDVRVRDLPALMELYELNYRQLRQLIPDFDVIPDAVVSHVSGALALHLTIVDRAPYTTTLRLTYQFDDKQGKFPAPDVLLRLYHDAQAAEVVSHSRRRGKPHAEYDRLYHHYPKEIKWEANRFLYKWLGYCLRQGHSFSPGRRQFSEAVQVVADEQLVDTEF